MFAVVKDMTVKHSIFIIMDYGTVAGLINAIRNIHEIWLIDH